MGWPRPQWIVLTVGLLAAVALPFAVPNSSWLVTATLGAVWLTLNQSWNLVLGFSGVWHFGQLAIYAIGAYVAALLSLHTGCPRWRRSSSAAWHPWWCRSCCPCPRCGCGESTWR